MRIRLAVMVMILTVAAYGASSATNANTVSSTLQVKANVQKTVQLTLSTGTGCAVSAGGSTDYVVDFGTVDALAINNGSCGSKFAPTTPGTTNAVYYTDYKLIPTFTSQAVSTNTITAYVSSNFSLANLSIVQANSTPSLVTDLTAMSTNAGAQTSVATNVTNGSAITRYVGVSVAPTNGAGLTGNSSATVTYTLTVQ